VHPRTLQRRLAESGTRYDQLLDRERRKQAQHYLVETGLSLSQVTGLLGYAEQSAFHRAFRRWFNTTPKEYRANMELE
jgi:AraC-like DNA-binding protein